MKTIQDESLSSHSFSHNIQGIQACRDLTKVIFNHFIEEYKYLRTGGYKIKHIMFQDPLLIPYSKFNATGTPIPTGICSENQLRYIFKIT